MTKPTVYVDGDILVAKAAFAAEASKKHTDECIRIFRDYLDSLPDSIVKYCGTFNEELTSVEYFNVEFGIQGSHNYRKDIATLSEYKGNRKKKVLPPLWEPFRELLMNYYKTSLVTGRETDDWCGTSRIPWKDYVLSSDKDFHQIPGYLIKIHKDNKLSLKAVTEYEAIYSFYLSLLAGDAADNIIGVPGIGAIRADQTLNKVTFRMDLERYESELFSECYEIYMNYIDKMNRMSATEDPLLNEEKLQCVDLMIQENAHLLWIQKQEKVHWIPPNIFPDREMVKHPYVEEIIYGNK